VDTLRRRLIFWWKCNIIIIIIRERGDQMPIKTERITVLGTPEFKAFLASEARNQGISISEFIRRRCLGQPLDEEQELLLKLVDEVKVATKRAKVSLEKGIRDAERVIRELRSECN